MWWALAASVALHAFILSLPGAPLQPFAPAQDAHGPVLTARLELAPPPAPPPAPAAQKKPAPEKEPAAPPKVLKDTIDPPQAEVLKDPIEPKPRPRPKPRAAPPKPEPKPEPKQAEARPPRTDTAAADRRGLDLRLPESMRRGPGFHVPPSAPPEQLSPNELRETLSRLSETMLFPPEALERGLEGEVTLLVELGEGGRILDATVASGSGYKILDDAAIRAVLKLGTLGPASANKSILLPVRFRII